MVAGWIKLHRKLLECPIFENEKLLKVFVWCLMKATHSGREQLVGRQMVKLEPGQFVFGRKKASEELRLPPTTVYEHMQLLKKLSTVDIYSDSKYSVVTVVNWAIYQGEDENSVSNSVSKHDSKSAADRQQIDTNKKVPKNVKKVPISKVAYSEAVALTEIEHQKLVDQHGAEKTALMIETLNNWKLSKGKTYSSDYHAILKWVVEAVEKRGVTHDRKERQTVHSGDGFDIDELVISESVPVRPRGQAPR